MAELIGIFVLFFTVIDPIGSVPVFIAATRGHDTSAQRRIAQRAVLFATGILLFFMVAGEVIIHAIDISLASFQIAGGIVLFLFALTMIFGESKPEEEMKLLRDENETAIFPLAVPSIASPGAMLAAVLLTDNQKHSFIDQVITAGIMLIVLAIAFVMLLAAAQIHKFIGASGASIISRVMGLILSAVAIDNILRGVSLYFNLGAT